MILFKEPKLNQELKDAPRMLRLIIFDFEKIAKEFNIDITITRILGRIAGDSGVHADHRAVDIRDEYIEKHTYNMDQRLAIFHYINAKYPRDDSYLTCKWHSFKKAPYHFHIQIPYKWMFINNLNEMKMI